MIEVESMQMREKKPMTLDLEQVRKRRPEILHIAAKYGIERVRLFGSVARGESKSTSDLDVLVQFERGRSLLDLAGFEQDLSEMLGCEVEVVSETGISPYLEERILAEAIAL
jgi:uncharacterized protein